MPRHAQMRCAGALIALAIAALGSASPAGAQAPGLEKLVTAGAPGAILLTTHGGRATTVAVSPLRALPLAYPIGFCSKTIS